MIRRWIYFSFMLEALYLRKSIWTRNFRASVSLYGLENLKHFQIFPIKYCSLDDAWATATMLSRASPGLISKELSSNVNDTGNWDRREIKARFSPNKFLARPFSVVKGKKWKSKQRLTESATFFGNWKVRLAWEFSSARMREKFGRVISRDLHCAWLDSVLTFCPFLRWPPAHNCAAYFITRTTPRTSTWRRKMRMEQSLAWNREDHFRPRSIPFPWKTVIMSSPLAYRPTPKYFNSISTLDFSSP